MTGNMKKNKFESNKKYFTISIYAVCAVLLCAIIIQAIVNWQSTKLTLAALNSRLSPFIAGAFIAYFIHPLVKTLDKKVFSKWLRVKSVKLSQFLSILTAYLLLLGIIVLFFLFIIPELADSITDLILAFPLVYERVLEWAWQAEQQLEALNPTMDLSFLESSINNVLPTLFTSLKAFLTNIIPLLYTASMSIIQLFFNIIISIIVSCYVLSDRKILATNIKRLLYATFSKKKADSFLATIKECDNIFIGFIIGKIIDSTIIGILCFCSMSLFKLPFTVLISVIVGVTNMIPYFGPFIGAVPGALILLITSPRQTLVFLILILVLQQFDGLFLGPKILGNSTGVRPLWIIFSITLGGFVAGPLGMFLGVPTIAVIGHLLNIWINKRLARLEHLTLALTDTPATQPADETKIKKDKPDSSTQPPQP